MNSRTSYIKCAHEMSTSLLQYITAYARIRVRSHCARSLVTIASIVGGLLRVCVDPARATVALRKRDYMSMLCTPLGQ